MRPSKLVKRALMAALALALCLGVPAPGALAAGIDMTKPCSLTVVLADGGRGIAGAEFELYRAGGFTESGGLELGGEFARCGVSLEGLDSSGWRAAAQTLAAYARRDNMAPDGRAETGRDGRARFGPLTPGLYLVTGERAVSGGRVYTPEPFLISLPDKDGSGAWDYSVTARCKFEDEPKPPAGDTVDVKVLKVWRGGAQQRPEEIRVQLLRDGKVCDTVTLSAENGWRHTWEGLDAAHGWQVVEQTVPEGYTVNISREGITFVITNTLKPSEEPEPTPAPTPGTPDTPGENLPQTGVLWWPVPLLAVLGALLLLLGWGLRRRDER